MAKFNIMTCKGFNGGQVAGWFNLGDCFKARFAMVILIFLFGILNKWVFSLMGISFNIWTAWVGSIVFYIVLISLTGAMKLCLALAIIVGVVTGLLGGYAFGGTETDE